MSAPENKPDFLFKKENYTFLIIGLAVIALGFILMSGSSNDNPAEWNAVSEETGEIMWQSRRRPDAFSHDGGKTYYCLDDEPYGEREPVVTAEDVPS